MKKTKVVILTILIALFTVGQVMAAENAPGEIVQTTCPVMGGKINKDIYTDYKGERVYFCCEGCIPEFQKDPEKYIQKLKSEDVTLEKVPATEGNKESSSGTDARGKQSNTCGNCGCES